MVNKEKMEDYFNNGVFLIAMIFTVVAIASLYSSIGALFGAWLDYKYRPIFDILFNLSILITCLYLIREKLTKR